jgi:hypothetical protein
MVFDLSGAHRLVVCYCDCEGTPPKDIQLIRARWFPATIDRPSTAFAFNILDFFHKLQNQNKCNPYDFYHAIIQRTDAAGLNPEIVRFFHFPLPFAYSSSPSTDTTRSPSYFASGATSSYSNEVELRTARPLPSRYPKEAWQSLVQPVPNPGRILLISPPPSCTNNFRTSVVVVAVVLTHFCCCCKMEKYFILGY